MVGSKEYLEKIKKIHEGDNSIQKMEFFVYGNIIELPYTGLKITKGYLSKQTQTKSLFLRRKWQTKYCVLDLKRFVFKYSKYPNDHQKTYVYL